MFSLSLAEKQTVIQSSEVLICRLLKAAIWLLGKLLIKNEDY
jgi:hypothetical protein